MGIEGIRQLTQKAQSEKRKRGEVEEKRRAREQQKRDKDFEHFLKVGLVREIEAAAKSGRNYISTPARNEDEAEQIAAHFKGQGYKAGISSGIDWQGKAGWDVRISW